MKKLAALLTVLGLSVCVTGTAWSHLPEGVTFYAFQFPDHLIPTPDGNMDDWYFVPDTYIGVTEDLFEQLAGLGKGGAGVDLSDLAVTYIVGWNEMTNRIYIVSSVYDDIHQVDRAAGEPAKMWQDDVLEMMFDADHSGGQFRGFSDLTEEENKRLRQSSAQKWNFSVPSPDEFEIFIGDGAEWVWEKGGPVLDWGWTFDGTLGGEGTVVYELSWVGYDDMNWQGPEVSEVHDLAEGEVIGFNLAWGDFDASSTDYDAYWTISGGDETFKRADRLADFMLLPIEPGLPAVTTVEPNTWGRIKSSFVK